MDFGDDVVQSSTSSSSQQPENVLSPTTPPFKHKKRAGRKIFKETRHPVYKGVRRKSAGKWVCEVREPNKKSRIWLGTFPDPETAAIAHDVAALALRGENAPLNFPDSARLLPRAPSSSHQDIQRAALEAAMSSGGKPLLGTHRQAFDQTRTVSVENGTERASEGNESGRVGFVDEEAMFNMPVLLDSLAEGLLLTPLAMSEGFSWSRDEVDDDVELHLWA
ncbi:UNVERIFIED_CONTAM: Dehydration-responsive element-binding protein 1D [Sesamum indicum]